MINITNILLAFAVICVAFGVIRHMRISKLKQRAQTNLRMMVGLNHLRE